MIDGNYRSQIRQDRFYIEEYLPKVGIDPFAYQGKFLEVGAHDGTTTSNTWALEVVYGWRGTLVEANPSLVRQCELDRPRSRVIEGVAWGSVLDLEFEFPGHNGTGDSQLARVANLPNNRDYFAEEFAQRAVYRVRTRTLAEMLGPGMHHYDYCSIDVEGAELEALKGIDWDTTSFDYLAVEWGDRKEYLNELIDYLARVGYRVYRVNHHDVDFVPLDPYALDPYDDDDDDDDFADLAAPR